MTITAEVLLAPLASAGIVGGVSWVAVRVSIARLEQRLADKDRNDERRFQQIEGYIGLQSGNGSAFMRRGECALIHKGADDQLEGVRRDVGSLRDEMAGQVERLDGRIDGAAQRT